MPTWRADLPPEGKHKGFDLKRTPCTGSLQAVITSEAFVVCDTHFWHGRTCPCERVCNEQGNTIDDSSCEPCLEKIGYRTHVYLSAFDPKRRDHFIFECTANAAKPLAEYEAANTTLRGCILYACRPKGTPNSKVVIETNTANLAKVSLPNPPDLTKALSVIWRIPLPALLAEPTNHTPKLISAKSDRMKSMRNQPDNVQEPVSIGDILKGNGKPK
jgi:hypothetical protein